MESLWIWTGLIVVATLGVLSFPLFRRQKVKSVAGATEENVSAYQEQVARLRAQLKQGDITEVEYQTLEVQAKKGLVIDAPEQQALKYNKKPSFTLAIGLIVLIPIIAFYLYQHWGYSDQLQQWVAQQKNEPMVQAELSKLNTPQAVIDQLQKSVQARPLNPKGWFLLGKLYLSVRNFNMASEAFAKANALKRNDVQTMLAYSESLFYKNNNRLTPKLTELLGAVLKQQPNNVLALNFLALGHFEAGEYQVAIKNWEKMLPHLNPDSTDAKSVMEMIQRSREALAR